ncbi:MAG: FtsH protease activity modulator HflK [bacterium]
MFGELAEEMRKLSRHVQTVLGVCAAFACLVYPLTGLYRVDVNETGVLKRFGKVIDSQVPPGIHYRLPWPIDQVERVGTFDVRRLLTGFGVSEEEEDAYLARFGLLESTELGTLLIPYSITSDKNIFHIKVIVKYRITDTKTYLFDVADPEAVLYSLTQDQVIKSVSRMRIDEVLTTGKVLLQQTIQSRLREALVKLPLGLSVVSVEVGNTRAPTAVKPAFLEVRSAQVESETMINEAESYRNRILPEAKGMAARTVAEAQAYRAQRIAHAEGEAARFLLLAKEYEQDKVTTKRRLYLQAVSQILPFVKTYIVGEDIADLRFLRPE